jgi:uncharacterized 2Fe-2S/4Fe-4S cluster protein (DUF4445 family)
MPVNLKAHVNLKAQEQVSQIEDGFGHTLLGLAQQAGIAVNARCAGEGVCGGCTVILESGQFLVVDEQVTATANQPCSVLACQTRLASRDATVRFPRSSLVEPQASIDDDFSAVQFHHQSQTRKFAIRIAPPAAGTTASCWDEIASQLQQQWSERQCELPLACLQKLPAAVRAGGGELTVTVGRLGRRWTVINIEPGDTRGQHFGVAVDIGTTTVVAMLVDLNQGTVLHKASSYNQQIRCADDVAARISHCRSAENLSQLQRLIVQDTINPLIGTLCSKQGISTDSISRMAVSGNTVMSHLFLGISPEGIGQVPFQPVTNCYDHYRGGDLGLRINPLGIVDVVPSISGYVGGDLVSDIYVARLHERARPTLLVDIGTNGEMVYAEDEQYLVCATAAGPAFEGYGTAHGCRAAQGAIEHITISDDLRIDCRVIGGGRASGLCGSAFIDFIAAGIRCGLINRMGRYDIARLHSRGRHLLIRGACGSMHACVVVHADDALGGQAIYVSEADIAQILKAKAAIYAGMKTLLAVAGRSFSEIERFCLAGGFARHIDLLNAIRIGLLPEIPTDRFELIGNGSLAGAMLALVDAEAMGAYETVRHLPRVVELNLQPNFENHFIDALALPNLDDREFPGVLAELHSSRR